MKHYNYILFDWDGCLAKTLDVWLDTYKKLFATYNVYPTDKQIAYEVFGDWHGCRKFGIEDSKKFGDKLVALIAKEYPHVALYPHAKEAISKLKRDGKKIALITTSTRHLVQKALENHGIEDAFDFFISGSEVTKHKPDPESLHKAMKALHAVKDETIMIGDSKSDLGAAKNAGIDSILFHPKHNTLFYELAVLKTFHPTYMIEGFDELTKVIK